MGRGGPRILTPSESLHFIKSPHPLYYIMEGSFHSSILSHDPSAGTEHRMQSRALMSSLILLLETSYPVRILKYYL